MEVSPSLWTLRDSPSSSHGPRRSSHKNSKKRKGGPGYDLAREERRASKKRREEPIVPKPVPRCIYVPKPGRPKPLTLRIPSLLEVKIMNVSLEEKRIADDIDIDDDDDDEEEEEEDEDEEQAASPIFRPGPCVYPSSPTSSISDLERTPEPKPRAFEPPSFSLSVDVAEASASGSRQKPTSVSLSMTGPSAARTPHGRTTRSILDESHIGAEDADDEGTHHAASHRQPRRSMGSRARACAAPYARRRPVPASARRGLAEMEAGPVVSAMPVPLKAPWPVLVDVQAQAAPSTGYITFDHMRGPNEDEEL